MSSPNSYFGCRSLCTDDSFNPDPTVFGECDVSTLASMNACTAAGFEFTPAGFAILPGECLGDGMVASACEQIGGAYNAMTCAHIEAFVAAGNAADECASSEAFRHAMRLTEAACCAEGSGANVCGDADNAGHMCTSEADLHPDIPLYGTCALSAVNSGWCLGLGFLFNVNDEATGAGECEGAQHGSGDQITQTQCQSIGGQFTMMTCGRMNAYVARMQADTMAGYCRDDVAWRVWLTYAEHACCSVNRATVSCLPDLTDEAICNARLACADVDFNTTGVSQACYVAVDATDIAGTLHSCLPEGGHPLDTSANAISPACQQHVWFTLNNLDADCSNGDNGGSDEQGECSARPEPPCFDDGVLDNEDACNAADGCVWQAGDEAGGGGEDDIPLDGPSCSVEGCNDQQSQSACAAFQSRNGQCAWADNACANADEGPDDSTLGGSGSGDNTDDTPGDDIDDRNQGNDNSACFDEDLDEDGCAVIEGCVWEGIADGGDDAGGGDPLDVGGSCSAASCYSQSNQSACEVFSGPCEWTTGDVSYCVGQGNDLSPGDDYNDEPADLDDIPSENGSGNGDLSPCFNDLAMASEVACTALAGVCVWQVADTDGEVGDDGVPAGNCDAIGCSTQTNQTDCEGFSATCAWENDVCTLGGDAGDNTLGGSGPETVSDDIDDLDTGTGGNGGAGEACFGDDIMDNEDACNAVDGCLWESFESVDGESDFGSCTEESCFSQSSGSACTGFGDTCEWDVDAETCADSSASGGDVDDAIVGDDDVLGGSDGEEYDCGDWTNNRNSCESNGCLFVARPQTTRRPATIATGATTIAATSFSTFIPIDPWVSSSTTAAPPPPTNSDGTCSRNCGTAENGGGTCRLNGRCLSCNANRVLQGGRCYASIACKGRRIQSGSQTGSNCRCVDDNCHYCIRAPDADVCTF